jgi:RNA polymerase sigma factor (sigma-70 family)
MSQNGVNTIIAKYENLYGDVSMTPDEMWRAAMDYQASKDEAIMTRLIGANIRLMVKEIIGITKGLEHVDEYIGSAVAGFIDGVNKLNVEKAQKSGLSTPNTYVFEWVRSYIRFDFNKDKAFLSGINGTTKLVYNKILQLINSVDMTREEIIAEVAIQLHEPTHIVESIYNSIGARVSDEHVILTEIPDTTYASKMSNDKMELMEVFPIVEEILTEKELYIIMSRMQERTLEDLGKELNITKEAIRLQEKKALKKLQKDNRLKEFHDAL